MHYYFYLILQLCVPHLASTKDTAQLLMFVHVLATGLELNVNKV